MLISNKEVKEPTQDSEIKFNPADYFLLAEIATTTNFSETIKKSDIKTVLEKLEKLEKINALINSKSAYDILEVMRKVSDNFKLEIVSNEKVLAKISEHSPSDMQSFLSLVLILPESDRVTFIKSIDSNTIKLMMEKEGGYLIKFLRVIPQDQDQRKLLNYLLEEKLISGEMLLNVYTVNNNLLSRENLFDLTIYLLEQQLIDLKILLTFSIERLKSFIDLLVVYYVIEDQLVPTSNSNFTFFTPEIIPNSKAQLLENKLNYLLPEHKEFTIKEAITNYAVANSKKLLPIFNILTIQSNKTLTDDNKEYHSALINAEKLIYGAPLTRAEQEDILSLPTHNKLRK